ncbi:hypothetical protein D1007_05534 [Hordeum vulgare]|nr:hypothetical protein D1007_05534 [Hordeum vulgare]
MWWLVGPDRPSGILARAGTVNGGEPRGVEEGSVGSCYRLNEWGATQIWPGSWPRRERVSRAVPLHFHALISGVLPPFSGFINAVLSHYQIHALHVDPRSLVLLFTFAFLWEAFVGITPSVALLRNFFSLEFISEVQCSGCASLRTVDATAPGVLYAELLPKAEGFQRQWVPVEAVEDGALFQPPPTPATPNRGWEREELSDPRLAPVLIRLEKLRCAGGDDGDGGA